MPDLGNLYFSLSVKNGATKAEIDKVKSEIAKQVGDKLEVSLGIKSKDIADSIQKALNGQKVKLNFDTSAIVKAIQDAQRAAGSRNVGAGGDITAGGLRAVKATELQRLNNAKIATELERQRAATARANRETAKLAREQQKAAQATQGASAAHQQAARSISAQERAQHRLNTKMFESLNLGSQLRNEFANLFSLYGISSFLQNIVQIGGELEAQRLALGAILQDTGKAVAITNQMQQLAVKSPFGVLDLNRYVKQLSAYSVPYNELYDTMKRLADISAGVGVDMGRIILAYGQVKAATVLRGTELRQFTEANIPMVEKLAERFSKLENRMVSAAEVYDMISDKNVSFEDVDAVLTELTSEGGTFYQMQEKMSESTKAKWKNLADAVDIMFADIANSTGGIFKWIAEAATTAVSNWELLAPVIFTAGTKIAWVKGVTMLTNRAITANARSLMESALAAKQKAAADLIATKRAKDLTAAERTLIKTANRLTKAEWEAIAASGALTKQEALRLIALKKITAESIGVVAGLLGITAAERQAAEGATRFRRVLIRLGAGLRTLKTALAGVFNPTNLIFMAIGGIYQAYESITAKASARAEAAKEQAEAAAEAAKNMQEQYKNLSDAEIDTADGQELINRIEKISQMLKDNSIGWAEEFNRIFATNESGAQLLTLEEQLKELQKYKDTVIRVQQWIEKKGAAFNKKAIEDTDGEFDEPITDNLSDWANELGKISGEIDDVIKSKGRNNVVKSLNEIRKAYTKFDKAVQDANIEDDIQAQIMMLERFKDIRIEVAWGKIRDNDANAASLISQVFGSFDDNYSYDVYRNDALADLKKYSETIKRQMEVEYPQINWEKLTAEQKEKIRQLYNNMISQVEGMTGEMRNVLDKYFPSYFKFVYAEDNKTEKPLTAWQNEMIDLVDSADIEAKIKAATDIPSVHKSVREMYEEAKAKAAQYEIILKGKISFDLSAIESAVEFTDINSKKSFLEVTTTAGKERLYDLSAQHIESIKQYAKLNKVIKASQEASDKLDFSLTDPQKEKKRNKGGKTQEDTQLKEWKAQLSLLKEAYSEYKKLSELIGKDDAIAELKDSKLFGNLFDDNKALTAEVLKSKIEELYKGVKQTTSARKQFATQLSKEIFGIDYDTTKKEMDKEFDGIKRQLEKSKAQYDRYQKVLAETGDESNAAWHAYGTFEVDDGLVSISPDSIIKRFDEALQNSSLSEYTYESLLKMFDDGGLDAIPKGLRDIFMQTYKEIEDFNRKLDEEYDKVVNSYKNVLDKERIIREKATRERNVVQHQFNNGDLTDEEADDLTRRINTNEDTELFKLSDDYLNFFNAIYSLTLSEATAIGDAIRKNLDEQLRNGSISAKEYADEIEKIADQIQKLKDREGRIDPLFEGGLNGFYKDQEEQAENDIRKATTAKKRAEAELAEAKKNGDLADIAVAEENVRKAAENLDDAETARANAIKNLAKLSKVGKYADMIMGIVNGINESIHAIYDAMDALGGGDDEGFKDAMAFFDAFSSVGENAKGMIDGALNGSIGQILSSFTKIFTDPITIFARRHDEKLQSQIEESQQYADVLQKINDLLEQQMKYHLGDTRDMSGLKDRYESDKKWLELLNGLGKTEKAEKYKRRVAAYEDGGAYAYQRQLQAEQLAELEKQLNLEASKKKKDDTVIADLQAQIEEAKQSLKDFAEELANTLYGIDLKGWASQLGDALFEAWKQGENGAEAFKKKAAEILSDVTNQVLKMAILEPMMKELQTMLFGEDGQSGMFGKDMELDTSEVAAIGEMMLKGASKSDQYLAELEKLHEWLIAQGYEGGLKGLDSESSLSSGIAGVTEQTADLLASYVNAIRADVSMSTEYLRQLILEGFPAYNVIAQAQLQQLQVIAANTHSNAAAAQEIRSMLLKFSNGTYKMHIV